MNDLQQFITVTCATGLETLLTSELEQMDVNVLETQPGAVAIETDIYHAYQVCLHSRIASRVLWRVAEKNVASVDELYQATCAISWPDYFASDKPVRILLDAQQTQDINTQFAAFKIKDGVRDVFQQQLQERPIAVKDNALVFVHVFWQDEKAYFSLDLAGQPLHQRGYRSAQGKAPLKETLAAAMLLWSGWPTDEYEALIDPFCGSGTLLIEAALLLYRMAPGMLRDFFALTHYKFFDEEAWQTNLTVAREQQLSLTDKKMPLIRGYDANADVIKAAVENIANAGFTGVIHVERSELANLHLTKSITGKQQGLIVTNAPYGERVETGDTIQHLYTAIGRTLRPVLPKWKVAVLSNHVEYLDKLGTETANSHRINNGPIRCYFRCAAWANKHYPNVAHALQVTDVELSEEQKAFVNRLRKNLKPLRKWAEREAISCYRIYDADMPEFNVAIDWYDGELHVQEYKPPKTVDETKAKQRLDWVIQALVKLLDVPRSAIQVKTRAKQKGKQQYNKLKQEKQFRAIHENGTWLLINLKDYLDTGVFLDHRPVRHWIQEQAQGKRFLNLFCYTGAATVHAAVGGAKQTVSVDMSRTYLDWARANLQLNGFSEDYHRLVQANCVQWLAKCRDQFDLIFMDPPTFSNSKRMKGVLDIQRDHQELIDLVMKRLEPGGKLLFS
ncbi:MAG: bifunctional 23S rRNA (guanine(2069)-N(7))-methyltransferase RlmK/23S rRNA (guanine(2445)-N(2))-methyltransferase RlmL, partial [Pseudomonadales bacterium]|nr:bifunctional 23S rRNA (guanine(2069)-N(7))-methyltransferase RlmK/23S rRNA (guanine(2445)-N(2))-methyltransferase RlmL [Pseudomonadales bacterium]